jgi:pimeloyl-ACP methyl ester carboxylesterase
MPTPLTQIIAVALSILVVILIYQSRAKSQVNYHLEKIAIEQPLDHNHLDGPIFIQHVEILIPNRASADSPVLFVLGGESAATTRRLVGLYKAYGERPNLILIQAEYRGYGNSLSLDADQTIPAYVTVNQALADFHAVIRNLKQTYTGIWMAAGYSYSGGLVIELAARYPDDIVAVLSSSGVVDWPFTMHAYDAKVRVIFGEATYRRLVTHINKLQPQEMFDRNWLEREFLIAFIHGVSQFTTFRPYRPVFNAATWLPTPVLLAILHGLD